MQTLFVLNADYADEFDCEEYLISEDPNDANLAEFIERIEDEEEFYFGTNEQLYGSDVKEGLTIKLITDEEAELLKSILGRNFGTGPLYPVVDHLEGLRSS
jgi:hypothetical protein